MNPIPVIELVKDDDNAMLRGLMKLTQELDSDDTENDESDERKIFVVVMEAVGGEEV